MFKPNRFRKLARVKGRFDGAEVAVRITVRSLNNRKGFRMFVTMCTCQRNKQEHKREKKMQETFHHRSKG